MPRRRDVLRSLSTAAVLPIAGCVGSSDGDGGDGSNDQSQDQSQSDESSRSDRNPDAPPVRIVISCVTDWGGSINTEDAGASIQGPGTESATIDGYPQMVSVSAQKQDDSYEALTVEIYVDGQLVGEQSTTAEYGVVRLSVNPQPTG